MDFRPCIDIHNGKVKQLVGGTLKDEGDVASENFVASHDADYYANMYKEDGLDGGHIIILNSKDSEYYKDSLNQAYKALNAYPNGMQIGGGINADNAQSFIDAGASHVIVTSYVFQDGKINYDNLNKLVEAVGKDRIVLDLSCRRKGDKFYIVTDRWQKFTEEIVSVELFEKLEKYCDEFLVHGVDVEGHGSGMDEDLVWILANYHGNKITYAGGISTLEEVSKFKRMSAGALDVTIGSALDIFGGNLPYKSLVKM